MGRSRFMFATMVASSVTASTMTDSSTFQRFAFEQFKAEYSRSYATPLEEEARYGAFVQNLALIDARNEKEHANGGSARHGITKFADLTQKEFASRFLTTSPSLALAKVLPEVSLKSPSEVAATDWTGIYTTPVKDQGYCGSCWAFSVAQQLESDSMRAFGTDFILSPQELVSCDSLDGGCNGGWPTNAYTWTMEEGGLVSESSYPYESGADYDSRACSPDLESMNKNVSLTATYQLTSEASMATYALGTGPIAVVVDASEWSTYTGGVVSVCGTSIDHAVQAVGIDLKTKAWKVRNSWGTSWGEAGFIYLQYGSNMCEIAYLPTFTDAALV